MQLSKYVDVSNAFITSAGSTDVIPLEVDTKDCEGVMAISWGSSLLVTITASHAASTTATFVSMGSSVTYQTSAAGFMCAVDIYKPVKRWIRFTATCAGNTDFGMFAMKYGLRKLPSSWSSTVGLPTTGGGVRCCVSPSSTA